MRIGFDIRPIAGSRISGVGEYALNLLKNILLLDKKNEYLLFYNSWRGKAPELGFELPENASLVRTHWPNKLLNLSIRLFKRPCLDRLAGGADRFIFPNIGYISAGCPYLLTVHDLIGFKYPFFYSAKRRLWHLLIDYKRTISGASCVMAVSQNTKNDILSEAAVNQEKVKIVYPAVKEGFRPIRDKEFLERQRARLKLPAKYILYLGTIEPRKNLYNLISAFNALKEEPGRHGLSLVLAGGYGWKYKKILKAASCSKFSQDIVFTGYIDEKEKIYYYNLAELFVYPSFVEGFGFPPLEAALCGAPVLIADNSSLSEVGAGRFQLFNPHLVNSLIDNISLILDKKADFSKSCFPKQQTFSWLEAARQAISLINK